MARSVITPQLPCREYRDAMRYALHVITDPQQLAMLIGDKKISDLTMDELEAAYELLMSANPRVHASAEYRSIRR